QHPFPGHLRTPRVGSRFARGIEQPRQVGLQTLTELIWQPIIPGSHEVTERRRDTDRVIRMRSARQPGDRLHRADPLCTYGVTALLQLEDGQFVESQFPDVFGGHAIASCFLASATLGSHSATTCWPNTRAKAVTVSKDGAVFPLSTFTMVSRLNPVMPPRVASV